MFIKNRNKKISELEQTYILALMNSWNYFKKTWKNDMSFMEYMTALRLGLEHPELKEILLNDYQKWWDSKGKPNDVYDIMGEGVE